jgi:hypothetical protein
VSLRRITAKPYKLVPTERQRLLALTIAIGGVCGLAAVAFHVAIRLVSGVPVDAAMSAPGHFWILWTVVTPARAVHEVVDREALHDPRDRGAHPPVSAGQKTQDRYEQAGRIQRVREESLAERAHGLAEAVVRRYTAVTQ